MNPLDVGHGATFACGGQRNNETIRAIPTEYRGIKFKSRLEARFAEWLDKNDAGPWFYEREESAIFDGVGRYYLADFYVKDFDLYVEVKPLAFMSEMNIQWNIIGRSKVKLIVVDNIDRQWQAVHVSGAIIGPTIRLCHVAINISKAQERNIKLFHLGRDVSIVNTAFWEEAKLATAAKHSRWVAGEGKDAADADMPEAQQ